MSRAELLAARGQTADGFKAEAQFAMGQIDRRDGQLRRGFAAPAAGSFVRGGGQVHLQVRIRGDDGPDVPAFHDDAVGALEDLPSRGHQLGADGRYRGNGRHRGGHLWTADG